MIGSLGARARPSTGRSSLRGGAVRPRGPALATGLVAVAAWASGCGATDFINEIGEPKLDIGRMEDDIRTQLQRDLEGRSHTTASSVASVGRVRCRPRSEHAASCLARVSRPSGRRLWRLTVSIDPQTGLYRYEVVN